MSSNKRRKLNEARDSQRISAFAARKAASTGVNHSEPTLLEDLPVANQVSIPITHSSSIQNSDVEGGIVVNSPGPGEDEKGTSLGSDQNSASLALQAPLNLTNATPCVPGKTRPAASGEIHTLHEGNSNVADVFFSLSPGERVVILGEYEIVLCSGQISILGATLSSKEKQKVYRVLALSSHSLPVIRFVEGDETGHAEFSVRNSNGGLRSLSELSPLFGRLFHDLDDKPEISFESHNGVRHNSSSYKILSSQNALPYGGLINVLSSPPEWNEVIHTIASTTTRRNQASPRILICGPKSSGKSTFARLLTNNLLTSRYQNTDSNLRSIMYLDLDPGQPEYTVSGQISLLRVSSVNFGPAYSHPISVEGSHEIIRSHAIGALSPGNHPILYMKCVHDLLQHYRTFASYPLLINTPGWILGTGLEILVEVIKASQPMYTIYTSQDGPEQTVTDLKTASAPTLLLSIPSPVSRYIWRTPADLRNMQALSYFHIEKLPITMNDSHCIGWSSVPLSAVAPMEVCYSGKTTGVYGIMFAGEQPPGEMIKDALDGTLLSVIVLEEESGIVFLDGHSENQLSESTLFTPEGIPYFDARIVSHLDPAQSRAIGMALLRGIDTKQRRLQLVTPIDLEIFRELKAEHKKIVLLSGMLDTPGWAYTESLFKSLKNALIGDGQENPKRNGQDQLISADDIGFDVPWIEKLEGDEGRGEGSQVWRVRRDLGRSNDG